MLPGISFLIFILIVIFLFRHFRKQPLLNADVNEVAIQAVLRKDVSFYQDLNTEEKIEFKQRLFQFLRTVTITGVNVEVENVDRAFIAAGAIIPIFRFKDWRYTNINEILLYPDTFSEEYKQVGKERQVLGMVGTGAMHRTMILSKPALRDGFLNSSDDRNTAIHEFVHLIDKSDGETDGLPDALLAHKYSLPWLRLISEKIQEIKKDSSDIDYYGTTNEAEFLAVAAEYFFEQPDKMEEKHPKLFEYLKRIFNQ